MCDTARGSTAARVQGAKRARSDADTINLAPAQLDFEYFEYFHRDQSEEGSGAGNAATPHGTLALTPASAPRRAAFGALLFSRLSVCRMDVATAWYGMVWRPVGRRRESDI